MRVGNYFRVPNFWWQPDVTSGAGTAKWAAWKVPVANDCKWPIPGFPEFRLIGIPNRTIASPQLG